MSWCFFPCGAIVGIWGVGHSVRVDPRKAMVKAAGCWEESWPRREEVFPLFLSLLLGAP